MNKEFTFPLLYGSNQPMESQVSRAPQPVVSNYPMESQVSRAAPQPALVNNYPPPVHVQQPSRYYPTGGTPAIRMYTGASSTLPRLTVQGPGGNMYVQTTRPSSVAGLRRTGPGYY